MLVGSSYQDGPQHFSTLWNLVRQDIGGVLGGLGMGQSQWAVPTSPGNQLGPSKLGWDQEMSKMEARGGNHHRTDSKKLTHKKCRG